MSTNTSRRASIDSFHSDLSDQSKDVVIAATFKILGRIGEGSFGEVFEAEDIYSKKKYAIKREPLRMRRPQINHETEIYNILNGGPGIPQCYWHGNFNEFDCIVIDLLGPNLNQLREVTTKLPLEVVVDFSCQMVSHMEHIHKRGLVYRDIKPDNFLFPSSCVLPELETIETCDGLIKYRYPSCEQVFKSWGMLRPKLFLVDFGLTTHWKNPETDRPYPEVRKLHKNKAGTARYASLNVHRGKPHTRRDDLESIGYLMLDLIFGSLPWTGIQARSSRAGWGRMKQIKEDTFLEDLYAGLPQGLLKYMEYARHLRFTQEPDYESLRAFLRGSVHSGPYSDTVKSPFGGHMEKKWVQKIDVDPTLTNTIPNTPFQNLLKLSRKHQKRVGWNSYKHDNQPWEPVIDWSVPDPLKETTWDDPVQDNTWASTVSKPWE